MLDGKLSFVGMGRRPIRYAHGQSTPTSFPARPDNLYANVGKLLNFRISVYQVRSRAGLGSAIVLRSSSRTVSGDSPLNDNLQVYSVHAGHRLIQNLQGGYGYVHQVHRSSVQGGHLHQHRAAAGVRF